MHDDEKEEKKVEDPLETIKEIISVCYEPGSPLDHDRVRFLNTVQIRDKINNFSGFGIGSNEIYAAMVELGFRITKTSSGFYWRCLEK